MIAYPEIHYRGTELTFTFTFTFDYDKWMDETLLINFN